MIWIAHSAKRGRKMEILLLLGGLVTLWIAARVGYRRRVRKWEQKPLGDKPDPMRPGLEELAAFLLVIGILSFGFGSVHAHLGPIAVAAVWFGLGGTLVASGVTALRS